MSNAIAVALSDVGFFELERTASTDPLTLAIAGFLALYSGQTFKDYKIDLDMFLRWAEAVGLAPLEAKRPHLELYIRWMEAQVSELTKRPWSSATIARRWGTIAVFYKMARIDKYVAEDPAENVRRPKINKEEQYRPSLSPLEHGIAMAAAEKFSPTAHALVALLGGRGLRIAEACSLDVSSLSRAGGYDMITYIGKGPKQVSQPLAVPVADAVFRAIGDRRTGPILLNERRNRMTRANATLLIRKVCLSAALPPGTTPHSLRRAFCSTLLASGAPAPDVQHAMRHASLATTMVYDRRLQTPARDASHALAAFLGGVGGVEQSLRPTGRRR